MQKKHSFPLTIK